MTAHLSLEHINDVLAKSTQLFTVEQVEAAIDKMAAKIDADLSETNLVCLTVMVGGLIPAGGLLKRLHFPMEIDYVHATRYRGDTTGKDLHWIVKPTRSLKDRTVLIIDDILDGGITLSRIVEFVEAQSPKKVYTAVLIEKECKREPGAINKADYCALTVENRYIYGYGMDYKEYLRNAPGIFAVAKEHE
ncbi:MAG: hypoxanthine-guanine phosphoribosyltransferase [Gammaproteobacteria bacterium]|nr:hypoxanthine-guanine phosphoribosyltransferase [Gammaproteobacteria bacterium]